MYNATSPINSPPLSMWRSCQLLYLCGDKKAQEELVYRIQLTRTTRDRVLTKWTGAKPEVNKQIY